MLTLKAWADSGDRDPSLRLACQVELEAQNDSCRGLSESVSESTMMIMMVAAADWGDPRQDLGPGLTQAT